MLHYAPPPELPPVISVPQAAQGAAPTYRPTIFTKPIGTVSLDPKQVNGQNGLRFSKARGSTQLRGKIYANALSLDANTAAPNSLNAAPALDTPEAEADTAEVNPTRCEPDAPGQTVLVEHIEVTAENPVFSQAELDAIFAPFVGRELTCAEQQQAADALTQEYLSRGYLTTRVDFVPSSTLDDVTLALQVQEGFIEEIEIVGLERLRDDYIRSRIEQVTSPPVSTEKIEDLLRLLRQNPAIENIEANLARGQQVRGSLLRVRVEEANPLSGYVGLDNYSPPPVGSTQVTLAGAHLNLTGRSDLLGASYQRTTTGGASTLDIGYALPVNAREGTLSLTGSFEWNRIPLSPTLDIDGNAQEYTISFRQPLTRTVAEEFALSLGFDYRNGQTFLGNLPFGFGFGPDPATGISRTSVIRFGQDYVKRDVQGAWSARSQFSLGLGILGATTNPAPIPDSNFVSWLGQAQRVQQLNQDNLLIVSADVQLTPDPLLPSEKFVIGGGQSIRGYRQNLRGGDNGFRLSAENRITLRRDAAGLSTLQLAPFIDMGATWNVESNPNPQPPQRFLMSLGLGLIWEPMPELAMRVDYGIPLIYTPRGNDLQDYGIYFRLGYRI
jgi:hemolysin activation/secretion protein